LFAGGALLVEIGAWPRAAGRDARHFDIHVATVSKKPGAPGGGEECGPSWGRAGAASFDPRYVASFSAMRRGVGFVLALAPFQFDGALAPRS